MLDTIFGYKFNNNDLLNKVLFHSSVPRKHGTVSAFERSELLGDKVLSAALMDILYKKYPYDDEGALSIRLAYLSSKNFMSDLFLTFGLDQYFNLPNDCKTDAVFTDCIEAVLGAIFIDSGYESVKQIVKKVWGNAISDSLKKDAKSRLQEKLQDMKLGLPIYKVLDITGPENSQVFKISVTNNMISESGIGTGHSKKEAEQNAAKMLLEKLK